MRIVQTFGGREKNDNCASIESYEKGKTGKFLVKKHVPGKYFEEIH